MKDFLVSLLIEVWNAAGYDAYKLRAMLAEKGFERLGVGGSRSVFRCKSTGRTFKITFESFGITQNKFEYQMYRRKVRSKDKKYFAKVRNILHKGYILEVTQAKGREADYAPWNIRTPAMETVKALSNKYQFFDTHFGNWFIDYDSESFQVTIVDYGYDGS